ncbi:MAG: site-specific integrase [Ruminococcaceae bacterium]|nr:site-specific integrase [Oscillospiraceae bacterium]
MKIPKAIQLKNGEWVVRLRLDGQPIHVKNYNKSKAEKEAQLIKAEYEKSKHLEQRLIKQPTLRVAIDLYIAERQNSVSPATIRTYRTIQKCRFQSVMDRRLETIHESEWQGIIDDEYARLSAKTVKTSWGLIKSVLDANKMPYPKKLTLLREASKKEASWLEPDDIKKFVKAAKDDPYCIPMLLALMSMRIAEIDALRWEDISPNADFIQTNGTRVMDEHHHWVQKDLEKTRESSRNVPLLIPELREAIKQQHKGTGKLLDAHQMTLRRAVERTCKKAGVPVVTVHQLRHSFASLSAHLRIPKEISMEIGGWSNDKTMDAIYTHICRSDIERYKNEMWQFYNKTKAAKK